MQDTSDFFPKDKFKKPIITAVEWVDPTKKNSLSRWGEECTRNGKIVGGISLEWLLKVIYKIEVRNDYPDDFRLKYPPTMRAEDGHMVRSRGELLIDNWLYHHRITHAYEPYAPIKEYLISDFYLNEHDVYIEYWGREDEEYIERRKEKERLYQEYKLDLIPIENEDIERLDDVLSRILLT